MPASLQKAQIFSLWYGMWNFYFYSRGHQTWGTTVVFVSHLWTGGAQSTGSARWGWWVLQTIEITISPISFILYFHILLIHTVFVTFIRWFSRIHRSKANCPGSQCQCVVQCGDEGWWDDSINKTNMLHFPYLIYFCVYVEYDSLYLYIQGTTRALVWWVVWWPPDTTTHATAPIHQSVTYFLQIFCFISCLFYMCSNLFVNIPTDFHEMGF